MGQSLGSLLWLSIVTCESSALKFGRIVYDRQLTGKREGSLASTEMLTHAPTETPTHAPTYTLPDIMIPTDIPTEMPSDSTYPEKGEQRSRKKQRTVPPLAVEKLATPETDLALPRLDGHGDGGCVFLSGRPRGSGESEFNFNFANAGLADKVIALIGGLKCLLLPAPEPISRGPDWIEGLEHFVAGKLKELPELAAAATSQFQLQLEHGNPQQLDQFPSLVLLPHLLAEAGSFLSGDRFNSVRLSDGLNNDQSPSADEGLWAAYKRGLEKTRAPPQAPPATLTLLRSAARRYDQWRVETEREILAHCGLTFDGPVTPLGEFPVGPGLLAVPGDEDGGLLSLPGDGDGDLLSLPGDEDGDNQSRLLVALGDSDSLPEELPGDEDGGFNVLSLPGDEDGDNQSQQLAALGDSDSLPEELPGGGDGGRNRSQHSCNPSWQEMNTEPQKPRKLISGKKALEGLTLPSGLTLERRPKHAAFPAVRACVYQIDSSRHRSQVFNLKKYVSDDLKEKKGLSWEDLDSKSRKAAAEKAIEAAKAVLEQLKKESLRSAPRDEGGAEKHSRRRPKKMLEGLVPPAYIKVRRLHKRRFPAIIIHSEIYPFQNFNLEKYVNDDFRKKGLPWESLDPALRKVAAAKAIEAAKAALEQMKQESQGFVPGDEGGAEKHSRRRPKKMLEGLVLPAHIT